MEALSKSFDKGGLHEQEAKAGIWVFQTQFAHNKKSPNDKNKIDLLLNSKLFHEFVDKPQKNTQKACQRKLSIQKVTVLLAENR